MERKTGRFVTEPVELGAKPVAQRPLSSTDKKDLNKHAQTHAIVSHLDNEFKDEYSGYGSKGLGDAANWAARQLGIGNEKAAQWWQDHARYTNEIRHGLFGAALTGNEKGEWEKADVNPGTQPATVKANLKRQKEIILGAIGREALSLKAEGYNTKAIEARMGISFDTLEKEGKKAEAIEWARSNLGDPRSKQILKAHGRE